MAGIFSKSATVPLHTWLPDAGVAPSTITSLLHAAILVKIGLYGFARIFCNGMVIPEKLASLAPGLRPGERLRLRLRGASWRPISSDAGVLNRQPDRLHLPRSCRLYEFGYMGALLYIMAHGLAKGGLFLCAGIIEHGTHTKDMTKMGGAHQEDAGHRSLSI